MMEYKEIIHELTSILESIYELELEIENTDVNYLPKITSLLQQQIEELERI